MSEDILVKLIETRLNDWAANQELPIAFEGVRFTPPTNANYARVKHLPATSTGEFMEGGHKLLTGLWQVSLVGPKGKGIGPLRTIALTLDDEFPQNLRLAQGSFSVSVTGPVSLGPTIEDPEGAKTSSVMLPCSFPYRADVIR